MARHAVARTTSSRVFLGIGLVAAMVLSSGSVATAAPADVRIIDGSLATTNEGLVSYGNVTDRHNCTATLVSPRFVLTATHCLPKDNKVLPFLRFKTLNWAEGEKVQSEAVISHPKADLTLLRLSRDVTDVKPVELATTEPSMSAETTVWGWGATECGFDKPVSPALKYAAVTVSGVLEENVIKGRRITMQRKTGTVWQGDSGGPAMFDGKQFGVASTADCGKGTNTYTSVVPYLTWIKSVAGIN